MRFSLWLIPVFFFQFVVAQNRTLVWSELLSSTPTLQNVHSHAQQFELEIILDVYDKVKDSLQRFHYDPSHNKYFYPASIVKLPSAIFACERINQLNNSVDIHTPLRINANGPCQRECKSDAFNKEGLPTIAGFIRKALTISDNSSFTRLYEWVGPEYYVHRFQELNMPKSVIRKKFDSCSLEDCRCVNSIDFIKNDSVVYHQPSRCYHGPYFQPMDQMTIGLRHMEGKKIISSPKDFSQNNCLPLENLHDLVIGVCYPQFSKFTLHLTKEQRTWIMESMRKSPAELHQKWKEDSKFHQHYYNFMFYGNKPEGHQEEIKITNIVGLAYGYTIESAVIEDQNGNFIVLSAKLYTNKNDIAGSGEYRYESISMPFMRDLGKVCLQWMQNTR